MQQELVQGEIALQLVQVLLETLLTHYLFQKRTSFRLQRQRVVPLQLFIKRLDLFVQVARREVVQPIRCVCIAEGNHERPVEVRLAEHFKFIGVLIALKVRAVGFLVQNVEA